MAIDIFNPVGSAIQSVEGARSNRINDLLTSYRFHVMDVSFSNPSVFSLSYGFRFASAPEIQIDVKEFKEGNFEYPRKVISGAKVSDISFHRGASFFDSDFYDWVRTAIKGNAGAASDISVLGLKIPTVNYRKNLLLIQYSDLSTGAGNGTLLGLSFQSVTQLVQYVPARAWMLYDCIPTSYKTGTDFDAVGPDISIMEMTVSPRYVEEFSLGV